MLICCFNSLRSLYYSFRENIMTWKSLACCCFSCLFILFTLSPFISLYIEEVIGLKRVKSLLFYWFVEIWLFFFVVASSWSSTITHLLSTFCDSLSNDKYEEERNKKNDQTWQKKEQNAWQYSFEKAYCTVTAVSLLQWCISSESATTINDVSLVNLLQRRTFSEPATTMYL